MFRVKPEFIGLVSIALIGGLLLPRLKALGRGTYPAKEGAPRVPVLVELFTSEGCSDCPPADALLEKLDRTQPVPGAEVIVLSEHVDYWNDLGWRDPYSSHEYSERQEAFARQFGLGSVYTPQMVVDGTFQVVGSDERRAIQAIRDAVEAPKIPVALSSMHFEEGAVGVHIGVSSAPLASSGQSINVFLAIADESDESHVSHGENEIFEACCGRPNLKACRPGRWRRRVCQRRENCAQRDRFADDEAGRLLGRGSDGKNTRCDGGTAVSLISFHARLSHQPILTGKRMNYAVSILLFLGLTGLVGTQRFANRGQASGACPVSLFQVRC